MRVCNFYSLHNCNTFYFFSDYNSSLFFNNFRHSCSVNRICTKIELQRTIDIYLVESYNITHHFISNKYNCFYKKDEKTKNNALIVFNRWRVTLKADREYIMLVIAAYCVCQLKFDPFANEFLTS